MIPLEKLYFHTGNWNEACALIIKHHYSHRAPFNGNAMVGTLNKPGGLFGDYGEPIAAITMTPPTVNWREQVIELSRLVKLDGIECSLTQLISKACNYLRSRDFDLVISYADQAHGHHGGIYQAASWNYHGRRRRICDGYFIGGRFVAKRQCNAVYGTNSKRKLEAILGQRITEHYDEGKHLYWRALKRSGEAKAKRLELEKNMYPKPDREAT